MVTTAELILNCSVICSVWGEIFLSLPAIFNVYLPIARLWQTSQTAQVLNLNFFHRFAAFVPYIAFKSVIPPQTPFFDQNMGFWKKVSIFRKMFSMSLKEQICCKMRIKG